MARTGRRCEGRTRPVRLARLGHQYLAPEDSGHRPLALLAGEQPNSPAIRDFSVRSRLRSIRTVIPSSALPNASCRPPKARYLMHATSIRNPSLGQRSMLGECLNAFVVP